MAQKPALRKKGHLILLPTHELPPVESSYISAVENINDKLIPRWMGNLFLSLSPDKGIPPYLRVTPEVRGLSPDSGACIIYDNKEKKAIAHVDEDFLGRAARLMPENRAPLVASHFILTCLGKQMVSSDVIMSRESNTNDDELRKKVWQVGSGIALRAMGMMPAAEEQILDAYRLASREVAEILFTDYRIVSNYAAALNIDISLSCHTPDWCSVGYPEEKNLGISG